MAPYNNYEDSFGGIVGAVAQVRQSAGELSKYYPPNYQGIIDSILDMSKDWSGANTSDYPPGWEVIYDTDGITVIGGNWAPGYTPSQGHLWYDERQGRLMVYVDDAYYQANGADVLTKVQNTTPDDDVPGAFWYNPDTNDLYVFDGNGWILVTSPSVTTATLPLSSPSSFQTFTVPPQHLPDNSSLYTQADYNAWVYNSLEALDLATLDELEVAISATSPASPAEGDLWFSTVDLELLIRYDGFWVPTSIPLTSDPNFATLESTVTTNRASIEAALAIEQGRILALENEEHKTYTMAIDPADFGIRLTDELGTIQRVRFGASDGLSVSQVSGKIHYSGAALQSSINSIQSTYTPLTTHNSVADTVNNHGSRLTSLENVQHVSVSSFDTLSSLVSTLPTTAEVDAKLSLSGGTMTGDISMDTSRILDLPAALTSTEPVRLAEFSAFQSTVASTYLPAANPVFDGVVVERDDIAVAGVKLVDGAAGGRRALELKTDNTTNSVAVFGQTSYPGEVAWEFGSSENFSWIHGTNGKQLRIDENGVIAKDLSIAVMQRDGNGNEVFTNTINVKDQLVNHEDVLNAIRSALNSSSTYADFKSAALLALTGL